MDLLHFLDCCSRTITFNFGETSKMICGISNSSTEVVWFKYGKRISNTTKTMLSSRYLHISCLESSDGGEYLCKDKLTSTCVDSCRLIVKNPGMQFNDIVHIVIVFPISLYKILHIFNIIYFQYSYNQDHQNCISKLFDCTF